MQIDILDCCERENWVIVSDFDKYLLRKSIENKYHSNLK